MHSGSGSGEVWCAKLVRIAGILNVTFSAFVGTVLLKVPWFTQGFSYCRWWGVECCMSSTEATLPGCTQGLQSIGVLALAGEAAACLLALLKHYMLLLTSGSACRRAN